MSRKACVVGSGPNGLAAAIVLAQAGVQVEVWEAEDTPGGAVRSMEFTLPGFVHDFGAAVFPLGAGSPFFCSLKLERYGLEWVHSPAALAHPFDDGTASLLYRDLNSTTSALGPDGKAWRDLMQPFVQDWEKFAPDVLAPPSIPNNPFLMARFGAKALRSAKTIVKRFRGEPTKALFGGLAAHSFLSLDEILSGAFGLMMGITIHAVGWPIARDGSRSLTTALCRCLLDLGGTIKTSSPVESVEQLSAYDLILCDVTPRQLLRIAGSSLTNSYRAKLEKFRYGPGAFKVDYALSEPIPWKAAECRQAATIHLGGSFNEIAASEKDTRGGRHAERPFVLLVQPSLFDPSRAPAGKHTAWAYCHVPNGSTVDMLPRIEAQIERFAPGFRHTVMARCVFSPEKLESKDCNLVGGDISGGAMDPSQLLFRPTWRQYATSRQNLYICSSSTPPGGGVHGMCGYHAAKRAVANLA